MAAAKKHAPARPLPIPVSEALPKGYYIAHALESATFTARIDRIRGGLPIRAVEALQRAADLNLSQVATLLGIPERTIARRKKAGKLTTAESDRVDRAARILTMAAETLGSEEKARTWMQRPNRGLGGDTPLSLLDTDVGVRAVEGVLARLDEGMLG
jgi:putative toxin-antitoxin system antitoxin component (TIGR02293 family)